MFWLFFKIDLRSAISLKRSRRELSNDMAEHGYILKNKGVVHILIMTKMVRILVIFENRPMFSHKYRKLSQRRFELYG